jgi:CRISPR-associated protein Cmr2
MKLKRDFHAHYALPAHDDQTQARGIDFLTGYASSPPRQWPEMAVVEDPAARLCLLAQARIAYTDRARVGQHQGKPGGLWHWIASDQAKAFFEDQRDCYLRPLGLAPAPPDLTSLPAYSFALQFTFRLRKPYLSRDNTDWHILDNPVRKEKVFGLPMVAPTGWKGALRAAMTQELVLNLVEDEQENESDFVKKRLRLYRLFGNEDASVAAFLNRTLARHWVRPLPEDADDEQREEWQKRIEAETKRAAQEFDALLREQGYRRGNIEGFQGRLRFYPTFFTQTGLEVINPHPRESGAGKQPIYFECVPIGAQGTFTLLYVPFDLFGEPAEKARAELADDLMTAGEGIRAMLTVYGFGAKTSSGFGLSDQQVTDGNLTIRTEAEPLSFPFDSLPGLSVLADAAAKQLRPGGNQ